MEKPKKIVITGGPSAGKTTALARIVEYCQEHGFYPVIIPEVATELINSGFDPEQEKFQDDVIRKMLFEERLRNQAHYEGRLGTNTVFIYDRGLCDGEAYVGRELYKTILGRNGIDTVTSRDLYDGVIFLHSAANGAEEFYTLANNQARRETLEEARELNTRTLEAWTGSPHVIEITNQPGKTFDDKMDECVLALSRILGVPEPLECERKFLLSNFDPEVLPAHTVPIDIVQIYLIGAGKQVERVRARGQDNRFLYFHTTKRPHGNGGSIEVEEIIDHREYENFLIRRDPSLLPIHKTRYCFHYEGQYCELDVFQGMRKGLVMLEIEVHDFEQPVQLPPFLGNVTEVTHDSSFSNYSLAQQA